MKNKTIYILLFVITFSIMHDTFISLLHPSKNIQTMQSVKNLKITQHVMDATEIHNMFHFLAVISEKTVFFDTLYSKNISLISQFSYTPPYKERAQKPPIV